MAGHRYVRRIFSFLYFVILLLGGCANSAFCDGSGDKFAAARRLATNGFARCREGYQAEGIAQISKAALIYKNAGGMEHESSCLLNTIGEIYMVSGSYDNAERSFNEALKIRVGFDGERYLFSLETLRNIGLVFASTGRLKQARATFTDLANKQKALLGARDVTYRQSLLDLACVEVRLGNSKAAKGLILDALAAARILGAQESDEYADCISCLAYFHLHAGDSAKAANAIKACLAIRLKVCKDERDYVSDLILAGKIYVEQNDLGLAEKYLLKAYRLVRTGMLFGSPAMADVCQSLAEVYAARGYLAKAAGFLEFALCIDERNSEYRYPLLIENLECYGELLKKMGKNDEAETVYRRLRILRRKK